MSHALSAFRHLLHRAGSPQWSRLERTLEESARPAALVPEDEQAVAETAELRHYLAAQTSQVV
ncbi:hypothetical protein [uncultured Friedmanniella sp.]|uniref:hypothetical protein n=1 Tax=uncultured Friedmanniella sp. TaxID=335381 RepID=UPI0035CC6CCC